MATFAYTSADRTQATIDAPDRQTALRELIRRGVTPTSLAQAEAGGAALEQGAAGEGCGWEWGAHRR